MRENRIGIKIKPIDRKMSIKVGGCFSMFTLFAGMRKTGVWAEIDLECIEHNVNTVKKSLDKDTKVCCVVKGNAYGHGAAQVSSFLEKNPNVDYLAVARIEEAMELRKKGIKAPILCLGYTYVGDLDDAINNNITLTIYNYDMAKKLNEYASRLGKKATIHIKIDSGMSRLGFIVNEDSVKDIKEISKLENIHIEGMYTHFAKADELDKESVYEQIDKFKYMEEALKDLNIEIKHLSNSAGILDMKELGFNMVRLGISMYGYYPSNEVSTKIKLKPALTLKTIVTNVKTIPEGTGVSYGFDYIAKEDTKIATMAVGYADGYPRAQKGAKVVINNRLLNIAGRICMDQSMVEIPKDLDVNIGDEVILMDNIEGITAEDIAKRVGTINYEVLCMLSRRVRRYYKLGESIIVENSMY